MPLPTTTTFKQLARTDYASGRAVRLRVDPIQAIAASRTNGKGKDFYFHRHLAAETEYGDPSAAPSCKLQIEKAIVKKVMPYSFSIANTDHAVKELRELAK